MKKYIPNILTSFRIFAAFIIPFLFDKYYSILAIIFFIALVSDLFDGYLARKWNVISNVGKILDILGDKLLALSSILVFIIYIDKYLVFLLIGELAIVSPAIYYLITRKALKKDKIDSFQSSRYGKLKTWLLFMTLGIVFISYKIDFFFDMIPFFIGITFALQMITVYTYIIKYLVNKKRL